MLCALLEQSWRSPNRVKRATLSDASRASSFGERFLQLCVIKLDKGVLNLKTAQKGILASLHIIYLGLLSCSLQFFFIDRKELLCCYNICISNCQLNKLIHSAVTFDILFLKII